MCAPGNKSILFHRSADLERWIRSILIPHFQYDMIRHKFQRHLLRPSVIRALPWNSATEARETWGKAPTTPHNRNAQEATSKPATCIFYSLDLTPFSAHPLPFEFPLHPPQMHIDLHEIARRISHRTRPRGRQPDLALFSFEKTPSLSMPG